MKEILTAVDGSEHSEKIVDYASALAKATSGKIILVYVMPEVKVPEKYRKAAFNEGIRYPEQEYFNTIGQRIISDMGEILKAKGVTYECIYCTGDPSLKILETANSRKVALIVLGVHGLHGVGRIRALGSVARRVVEDAAIPVILVP